MTQIQEPLQLINGDPFMSQMNPNINLMGPMNFPPMMHPPPINIQPNGNYPMPAQYQVPNNSPAPINNQNNQNQNQNQNQNNNDQSNYIFFNFNIFYYYRKTQKIKA